MIEEIEENRKLCDEFPFLIPRNEYTGEKLKDYDYSFTLMNEFPIGWVKRFGCEMCSEIKASLEKEKKLDDYRVVQVKEKFGGLRWYDENSTDEIEDVILPKYEELSYHTCVGCGAEATLISKGWVMPYCEACAKKMKDYTQFAVLIKDN